ncbi:MAG: FAD-dependent protein, partial [Verrucomicrobiota bacterium]
TTPRICWCSTSRSVTLAPKRTSHPHIGSNLLPNVVKAIRQSIIDAGGEVRFGAKVTDLLVEHQQIRGVVINETEELLASAVILATGHSARDIYSLLQDKEILMEQKAFAVGVRIEHPQPLIDSLQYHYDRGTERPRLLPAARYSLATKIRDRGVHSFCMCPGGFVVPAATENDEVVVNGMSLSKRDSPFANSGMVVTVEPEDVKSFSGEHGVLAGIAFQKHLEQVAKEAGGGGQVAPGQRVLDFLAQRSSDRLPDTSYKPGLNPSRIDELLPHFISERMREGLELFGRKMKGYITEEANLLGFETRTSSPVRIPRNPDTLQHPEIAGLFPCGEGAGFAGGIVSAALDGMKCAGALPTR